MDVRKFVTRHPMHSVRPCGIQKSTQVWSRSLGETEPNHSEAPKNCQRFLDRIFSPFIVREVQPPHKSMWALFVCTGKTHAGIEEMSLLQWQELRRKLSAVASSTLKVEAMVTSQVRHRAPSTPGVMHIKTSPCTLDAGVMHRSSRRRRPGRKRGTQTVLQVQTNNFSDQKS